MTTRTRPRDMKTGVWYAVHDSSRGVTDVVMIEERTLTHVKWWNITNSKPLTNYDAFERGYKEDIHSIRRATKREINDGLLARR